MKVIKTFSHLFYSTAGDYNYIQQTPLHIRLLIIFTVYGNSMTAHFSGISILLSYWEFAGTSFFFKSFRTIKTVCM